MRVLLDDETGLRLRLAAAELGCQQSDVVRRALARAPELRTPMVEAAVRAWRKVSEGPAFSGAACAALARELDGQAALATARAEATARRRAALEPAYAEAAARGWQGATLRLDGRVELICPHGVGHPDEAATTRVGVRPWRDVDGVHGCDGCCGGLGPDEAAAQAEELLASLEKRARDGAQARPDEDLAPEGSLARAEES